MPYFSGDTFVSNMLEYDEVLEKIGYGKTQWILLLISGLLTITSVAAQQTMSIVVIASRCEFETTEAEKGVMMAAYVAGRRKVLLYGTFSSSALLFILMFVTSVWLFNIINLLSGISLGGVSAAIYAYLSEFNIPRHRAVAINYSTMFVSVSAIYVPATAWAVLSYDWSIPIVGDFVFRPWRLLMLLTLLPGIIGGLILIRYPESPKYLLSQQKEEEALIAVDWISKFNRGLPITQVLNCNEVRLKPEIQAEENIISNYKGWQMLTNIARATKPLFQKPHGFNFVLCNVALFCMFFSSNGIQLWFPEIVNRSSNDENRNSTVCEILGSSEQGQNELMNSTNICSDAISTNTYIDSMIVGVAFLVGFSIQGVILNPLGRKNVLMAALILSILSGFLLHFVANPIVVLILFCLCILLPGLSISIMLGAIVDLVPTSLRGKAVSLCMSLGRLGTIAGTNLMGIILLQYCTTTFALLSLILIVCFVVVYHLPIRNSA
ncbi:synaptic vesicle glycoprotein 2B isoform X2 [Drosophila hydei]|uniref:Synaptic vesicle glycoprotein 2B isoform X2 n=1 Tax=Drosophila hydei TaxID=7224 RepID=A0A6J1M5R0_DROHY|nr:synaptic vesicle glycoprotein 2B isoform X2 [Drosophila hydei]